LLFRIPKAYCAPECKAEEKYQPGGTPRARYSFAGLSFGSGRSCGTGWGGDLENIATTFRAFSSDVVGERFLHSQRGSD
jgi:hypothetical protein